MGKYTNIFNTIEEYNTYMNGDPFLPSLCLIEGSGITYDKRKGIKSINVAPQHYVGETIPITVNCDADIPKDVSLEVDGKQYTASVNSAGTATFEVNGLSAGNKIVYVTCPDDWRYQSGSTEVTVSFDVVKVECAITATAKDITVGKTETITVSVPDGATGECYTEINGVRHYATVINGKAQIKISDLPAGDYMVTVRYEGDDKYTSAVTTTSFRVKEGKL